MIVFNDKLQCLECSACGRLHEVCRAVYQDAERRVELLEKMQQEHVCKPVRRARAPMVHVWLPPSGATILARAAAQLREQGFAA